MKKRKEKIYIKQWLSFKPYDNQIPSDSYYLKLCNDVKQAITADEELLQVYLEDDLIDELACFLTSYFEDLISETNIWNTFVKAHKRLYGKSLPFYEIDEYYTQEINLADVCFLTWYFINAIQDDKIIYPFDEFILEISDPVMDVFEDAWEYAPENEILKTFYVIDEEETDFYIARELIDTVLFKTYLFYPDSIMDLLSSESEILEQSKEDEYILNFINENRDEKLHNSHTRLLGFKGQEWAAELLGNNHSLSKDFSKISKKIRGYFFYKGQDNKNVFLEHIASGKAFDLTKKSFDHYDSLKDIDTILFIGIVLWKNEWWFSGIYSEIGFNADLILDEKNSIKSRNQVSFLDHQSEKMDGLLEQQLRAFMEFNKNQPIAFMDSDKINSFIKNYYEFFNDSLNLSQKEKDESKQRVREDGFFRSDHKTRDFSEAFENGLVFFNPKSGIEIALDVNSAFPMKENPFYDENKSAEHIMRLFFVEELSAELAMYCIDNFKNDLKFFKSPKGKVYLDNIDFLLRFWKKGNYFAVPTTTFIGKEA